MPAVARNIDTFDDGLIGVFSSSNSPLMDNYTIIFFDWDGKTTGKLMKRNWDNFEHRSMKRSDMFYYMNDELRINEGYFDTVYAVGQIAQLSQELLL